MTDPVDDPFVAFLFASRTRRDGTPVPAPRRPLSTSGGAGDLEDALVVSDPVAYAKAAVEGTVRELAETTEGGRNHALNSAAFSLGSLIGGGMPVDPDEVETLLYEAAEANGYAAEHGDTLATIRRGLADGANKAPLEWLHVPPVDYGKPAGLPGAPVGLQLVTLERTSWSPRDLDAVLEGREEEQPPAILARTDGSFLFYRGKVNALIGESESGKTWVALIAVAVALGAGERVVYLDFEDTASGIVSRLRSLGVDRAGLAGLVYIAPDEALHPQAAAELHEAVDEAAAPLVIVDGVNAAMTLLGLDLNSNTDTTQFSLTVLRPLKRTGAAVVTIDHVTKSKDGRGSYAIGAQAKRADIDGCALLVEVERPFGRGMTGRLKLVVSKDRPGHVRAVAHLGKVAGTAVLCSSDDGTIDARIDPHVPRADDSEWRPTTLMARVAQRLGDSPGATRTVIKGSTSGKNEHVLEALDYLIADGYVEVKGSGHHLVKTYVDPEAPARPAGMSVPASGDARGRDLARGDE